MDWKATSLLAGLTYLVAYRVPRLRIQPAGDAMNYKAQWQGGQTFFFLNEMQVDAQTIASLPTAEIAFVKVMKPPF